jgi:hypothetical protein
MAKKQKDPTLGDRLQAIERRYKLSPSETAKLLGIDASSYYSKYRYHEKTPTAWQRLALDLIDMHGVRELRPRLGL